MSGKSGPDIKKLEYDMERINGASEQGHLAKAKKQQEQLDAEQQNKTPFLVAGSQNKRAQPAEKHDPLRDELQKRLHKVRANIDESEQRRKIKQTVLSSKNDKVTEDEKRRRDEEKERLRKIEEEEKQKIMQQYSVLWGDLQGRLTTIREQHEEELRKAEKEEERVRKKEEEEYLLLTPEERERLQAEKEAHSQRIAEVREKLRLQAIEHQEEQDRLAADRDKVLRELKNALVLKQKAEKERDRLASEETERKRKHEEETYRLLPEEEKKRIKLAKHHHELELEKLRLQAAKEKEQRHTLEEQQRAVFWDLKKHIELLKERKRLKTESETEEDRVREARDNVVRNEEAKAKKAKERKERIYELRELFRKAKEEKARAHAAWEQKRNLAASAPRKYSSDEEFFKKFTEITHTNIDKIKKYTLIKESFQNAFRGKNSPHFSRKEKIRLRAEYLRTVMEEIKHLRSEIENEELLYVADKKRKLYIEERLDKNEEKDSKIAILENKISSVSAMDMLEHSGVICSLCGSEVHEDAPLVLCNCADNLMHKECLEESLRITCTDTCNLCGYKYALKREPWFTMPEAFFVWIAKGSNKIQLLLIVLLVALVSSEMFLCYGLISDAIRNSKYNKVRKTTANFGTRFQHYWNHVGREVDLPGWALALAVLVLWRQAILLSLLIVESRVEFLRWYCKCATITMIDVISLGLV